MGPRFEIFRCPHLVNKSLTDVCTYHYHTFVTLSLEPLILTKTGEVSDVHKLQKTIISHRIGTKCCNFLTVYQNDSDSDSY